MKEHKEFLHIFAFQNIYCEYFQQFVEENLDTSQHSFIYLHKENASLLSKIRYWRSLGVQLARTDKIILHFLPTSIDLFFWMMHQKHLNKAIWSMWGRDVFYPMVRKQGINKWVIESMRKRLIPRIGKITGVPSDYEFLQRHYGIQTPFHHVFYPLPGFTFEEEIKLTESRKPVKILLGNSADPSNRHIQTLELCAKFKDQDLMIYCPLSYGGTPTYIAQVRASGNQIFGDKFEALLDFLPIETYKELLADIDICIMNHERQQGLGNIGAMLFQGKKIYMSRANTPFDFYTQELGFHIEDAQSIKQQNFEDFMVMSKDQRSQNHQLYKQHFGKENILRLWVNLFQS